MGITRSQYIQGNSANGTVLGGTVQGVTAGAGVSIAADGTLSITQSTTTQIGGALLATALEAETGTDFLKIITPGTLKATAVYKSEFNAKGDILSASANDVPLVLSVGTDGQYLKADSTQPVGLIWNTISASDIIVSPAINGNTNLNTVLQDALYGVFSTNTSITVATAVTGLVTLTAVDATTTQKGVVELATAAEVITGTSTTLVATADGVRAAAIYKSDLNAKGDLISATANDTPTILSVGTDGQFLVADSTAASGLRWATTTAVSFVALDNISSSFNGVTTAFPLSIGAAPYAPSPSTNLMVFLGGVPQIPGAGQAYTVSGSTITFDSAPLVGMSFYATTVV
jgi:hypothetical protein